MRYEPESPSEVLGWFQNQAANLGPALLGALNFRRCPCVRKHCRACASGEQHPSYVLYGRVKGRRFTLYVPEELVPEVQRCLHQALRRRRRSHQLVQRGLGSLVERDSRCHSRHGPTIGKLANNVNNYLDDVLVLVNPRSRATRAAALQLLRRCCSALGRCAGSLRPFRHPAAR
jgi:hypothetical protein